MCFAELYRVHRWTELGRQRKVAQGNSSICGLSPRAVGQSRERDSEPLQEERSFGGWGIHKCISGVWI